VPFKPFNTTSCCLQSCHNYCPFSNMPASLLVGLHGACSTSNDLPPFLYRLQHPAFLHNQYLLVTIVPFRLQVVIYWHFPYALYHYLQVATFMWQPIPCFSKGYQVVCLITLYSRRNAIVTS